MAELLTDADYFFATFACPADFTTGEANFVYNAHSLAGVDTSLANERWSAALAEIFVTNTPHVTEKTEIMYKRGGEESDWITQAVPPIAYTSKIELLDRFSQCLPFELIGSFKIHYKVEAKLIHVTITLPPEWALYVPLDLLSHFGVFTLPLSFWKSGENKFTISNRNRPSNWINVSTNFVRGEASDRGVAQILRTVDCTHTHIHFQPAALNFLPVIRGNFLRILFNFSWQKSGQTLLFETKPEFFIRVKFRKDLPIF